MPRKREEITEEIMQEPLYKEELLGHYRHPRNYGELADAHVSAEALNPSCGDEVTLHIIVKGDSISNTAFQGKGCVISQAAASMLTVHALKTSIQDLQAFSRDDMLSLIGISLGPTRLRCALLALESLHKAIEIAKKGIGDA